MIKSLFIDTDLGWTTITKETAEGRRPYPAKAKRVVPRPAAWTGRDNRYDPGWSGQIFRPIPCLGVDNAVDG